MREVRRTSEHNQHRPPVARARGKSPAKRSSNVIVKLRTKKTRPYVSALSEGSWLESSAAAEVFLLQSFWESDCSAAATAGVMSSSSRCMSRNASLTSSNKNSDVSAAASALADCSRRAAARIASPAQM